MNDHSVAGCWFCEHRDESRYWKEDVCSCGEQMGPHAYAHPHELCHDPVRCPCYEASKSDRSWVPALLQLEKDLR